MICTPYFLRANTSCFINIIYGFFSFVVYVNIQVQNGLCSYHKPNTTEVTEISDQIYYTYGLNASHPLSQYGMEVEITYRSKKLNILVNNLLMISNETFLELSEEAANELGIIENTVVRCEISIMTEEEPYGIFIKPISIFTIYIIAFCMIIFW